MTIKNIKSGLILAAVATGFIGALLTPKNSINAAVPLCADTDNGVNIFTSGSVTNQTTYDTNGNIISIGETVNDICLSPDPILGAGKWITGNTGTHIQEASCMNSNMTDIVLSVHICEFGCTNGACNLSTTPTPTSKKIKDEGYISKIASNYMLVKDKVVYFENVSKFSVGQKVEYKGYLNVDGSVSATKIELE